MDKRATIAAVAIPALITGIALATHHTDYRLRHPHTTLADRLARTDYVLPNGKRLTFTASIALHDRGDTGALDLACENTELRFASQGDSNFVVYDRVPSPWKVLGSRSMTHEKQLRVSLQLYRQGDHVLYQAGTGGDFVVGVFDCVYGAPITLRFAPGSWGDTLTGITAR